MLEFRMLHASVYQTGKTLRVSRLFGLVLRGCASFLAASGKA
jgi:hypothetical protein